jgi:hypothetical protein
MPYNGRTTIPEWIDYWDNGNGIADYYINPQQYFGQPDFQGNLWELAKEYDITIPPAATVSGLEAAGFQHWAVKNQEKGRPPIPFPHWDDVDPTGKMKASLQEDKNRARYILEQVIPDEQNNTAEYAPLSPYEKLQVGWQNSKDAFRAAVPDALNPIAGVVGGLLTVDKGEYNEYIRQLEKDKISLEKNMSLMSDEPRLYGDEIDYARQRILDIEKILDTPPPGTENDRPGDYIHHSNDVGLFQINDYYWKKYATEDPIQNIKNAKKILDESHRGFNEWNAFGTDRYKDWLYKIENNEVNLNDEGVKQEWIDEVIKQFGDSSNIALALMMSESRGNPSAIVPVKGQKTEWVVDGKTMPAAYLREGEDVLDQNRPAVWKEWEDWAHEKRRELKSEIDKRYEADPRAQAFAYSQQNSDDVFKHMNFGEALWEGVTNPTEHWLDFAVGSLPSFIANFSGIAIGAGIMALPLPGARAAGATVGLGIVSSSCSDDRRMGSRKTVW